MFFDIKLNWFTKHNFLTCVDIWNSILAYYSYYFCNIKLVCNYQCSHISYWNRKLRWMYWRPWPFLKQPVAFNFHDNLRLSTVFTEDESNEDFYNELWTISHQFPSDEEENDSAFVFGLWIWGRRSWWRMWVVRLIAYFVFLLLSDYCYIIQLVARGIYVYFRL